MDLVNENETREAAKKILQECIAKFSFDFLYPITVLKESKEALKFDAEM